MIPSEITAAENIFPSIPGSMRGVYVQVALIRNYPQAASRRTRVPALDWPKFANRLSCEPQNQQHLIDAWIRATETR